MRSRKVSLTLFVFLLFQGTAFADKKLSIEASRVEYDQSTGISSYYDNVKLSTAGLQLSADTVQVRHAGKAISIIDAQGNPARFVSQLADGSVNSATAKTIKFDVVSQTVVFSGEVRASYQGGQLQGEHLIYDLRNEHMRVEGSKVADERVRIEIDAQDVR